MTDTEQLRDLAPIARALRSYGKAWQSLHRDIADDFLYAADALDELTALRARVGELEGARIVAWLRKPEQEGYSCVCSTTLADAIERGDWK